jgi:4-alpha-glucanotransferase
MTGKEKNEVLPQGRHAGVCLHISSLPGPYGIGEIGQHARAFVDAMVDMRLSVWQFLPTGPTAYGDSPYQPLSTFAGNELLIDVGELIAMNLLDETDVRELTTLPADFIDYGGLIPIKKRVLQLATARFSAQANAKQRSAYQAFVQKHNESWLHDYALFRILKTQHDERPWPEWQPKFVHRDPV